VIEPWSPETGVTVLEPDGAGRGHWVGAPSVLDDDDRVLLAYRKRRPRGEPNDRGYECCIAQSTDGVHFADVWSVTKDRLRSASMERFCLRRDRAGGYLLYLSYEHPDDGRWRIDVCSADAPDAFDVSDARTVLTPEATGTAAVKDPWVVRAAGQFMMFVSTFLTDAGPAPTSLAVSDDGVDYEWLGTVLDVGKRGTGTRLVSRQLPAPATASSASMTDLRRPTRTPRNGSASRSLPTFVRGSG
jgi:hypothetical protein